jgi:serralysin
MSEHTNTPAGGSGDHVAVDASVDGLAPGTGPNGKDYWTPEEIAAYLNRSGAGFAGLPGHGPQSDSNLSVIEFGFHTSQTSLFNNGYVVSIGGGLAGLPEFFNFTPFSTAQRGAATEALQAWDDVIAVSFQQVAINDADIAFGNLTSAPTTQAYAYLPTNLYFLDPALNVQVLDIGGDVWISLSQANNLQLDEGRYGMHTLAHEIGHALGISHPGAYNAAPGVSITYAADAEYFQDNRVYSIMSYFDAFEIGARHFDFHISSQAFSAVPLIHDILVAQSIYGADMTTRTGDTVYGFNSTAGRDSFDFVKTPAPIGAIWDAGGIDTLDTSGFATTQLIDLRQGALSSIGGVTFDTAPTLAQVNANRALQGMAPISQATYDGNMAALAANPAVGRLTDNFGIAYGVTIENAIGGSGADTIIGNEVANVLIGNAGNDTLNGGLGADSMSGGTGNDFYYVDAGGDLVAELIGQGTDTVSSMISYTLTDNVENLILTDGAAAGTGNGLDNVITGNAAANQLSGLGGNDRLIGGDGTDRMTGGAGNDVFVGEINAATVASKTGPISLDLILDFQSGADKIDLSGIDANSTLAGDQAFTWVNNASGNNAGDVWTKTFGNMNAAEKSLGIEIDGVDGASPFGGKVTVVFGNVDGGDPDFAIVLVDNSIIAQTDFLF